ncbi:hypothetical protein VCHE16_3529 [Vibrio paracholerae HE-16]|uniref:Uncharacterized protein n=1 Tax=Vibrio cholerae TaxID=666 RepID=A0A8B5ZGG7_VIBCL|nr:MULTISPECIES: hypothetical protein [Vibrio]EKG84078.1 hypothetical protein VCHE16_3529 [Vibrio paracholerae HE-16]ELJ8549605.1 hypothetical protein [Vibrio cholerae]ELY5189491.1 hypothetical protein [Vibrio cholerae]ELY5289417.1 hypothetical protein [Vibrio cholerae]MBW5432979.1 hypothetical protein [Vibrio cholerae]
MGKNSKAKRDKKKKKTQKVKSSTQSAKPEFTMPDSFEDFIRMQGKLDKLFDPELLTSPESIDGNILEFCKLISDSEPVFIDVEPEDWCRQSCCDLNVNEYIKANGGQIVCGYKLWYNKPNYIEGERHAVWKGNDGSLKDITFNADGETRVLFIADVAENQLSLEANKHKIRWGKTKQVQDLISFQEEAESMIPTQTMSDSDAWATAITYKDWSEGKRMPSHFLKVNG